MKKIFVEIADTPIKRSYGLMDRKRMSFNSGMLFKFSSPEILSFWMKDTYIPLDIAFINDDKKIIQISEMIPLSTRPIKSIEKCCYALETNRNWFIRNNIRVGNIVDGYGIKMRKNAQIPPQQNNTVNISPDIMINRSFKETIEDANNRNQRLIIIYKTQDDMTLPPKTIEPPFEFIDDKDGNRDAIVRAWDKQTAGWKSFLLDNIIDLEIDNTIK